MGTKKAISLKALEKQFGKLDKEADDLYAKWSKIRNQRDAVVTVLSMYGIEVKKEASPGEAQTSFPADQRGNLSPLRERITKIYAEAKKPLKASAVRQHLREKKIPFTSAQFWRTLSRMEGKGVLKRLGGGMYQLVNGA